MLTAPQFLCGSSPDLRPPSLALPPDLPGWPSQGPLPLQLPAATSCPLSSGTPSAVGTIPSLSTAGGSGRRREGAPGRAATRSSSPSASPRDGTFRLCCFALFRFNAMTSGTSLPRTLREGALHHPEVRRGTLTHQHLVWLLAPGRDQQGGEGRLGQGQAGLLLLQPIKRAASCTARLTSCRQCQRPPQSAGAGGPGRGFLWSRGVGTHECGTIYLDRGPARTAYCVSAAPRVRLGVQGTCQEQTPGRGGVGCPG